MALFVCDLPWMMDFAGAARRRRERHLRAFLRYARMSVAMALAESNHHTNPRGPKMARAWEEGHEDKYDAPRGQKPLPPQHELFQLAAHRGPHHRCLALPADPSCACAADEEQTCGIHVEARHCEPRAGYRSAQDLSGQNPIAFCWSAPSPKCGTVGGSADCHVSFLSAAGDCRADHWHSSSSHSWWSWRSSRFSPWSWFGCLIRSLAWWGVSRRVFALFPNFKKVRKMNEIAMSRTWICISIRKVQVLADSSLVISWLKEVWKVYDARYKKKEVSRIHAQRVWHWPPHLQGVEAVALTHKARYSRFKTSWMEESRWWNIWN